MATKSNKFNVGDIVRWHYGGNGPRNLTGEVVAVIPPGAVPFLHVPVGSKSSESIEYTYRKGNNGHRMPCESYFICGNRVTLYRPYPRRLELVQAAAEKDSLCRLCGEKTSDVVNISFKAVHVCDRCAASVTVQQVQWWSLNKT